MVLARPDKLCVKVLNVNYDHANSALLAKIGWMVLARPDKLCVKVLNVNYDHANRWLKGGL
jgi:hypothetical protein